jgi:hypothetical protein
VVFFAMSRMANCASWPDQVWVGLKSFSIDFYTRNTYKIRLKQLPDTARRRKINYWT